MDDYFKTEEAKRRQDAKKAALVAKYDEMIHDATSDLPAFRKVLGAFIPISQFDRVMVNSMDEALKRRGA